MSRNNKKKTKGTRKISATFPIDLIEKIDKERGLIPRSTYITEKLKRIRWKK